MISELVVKTLRMIVLYQEFISKTLNWFRILIILFNCVFNVFNVALSLEVIGFENLV